MTCMGDSASIGLLIHLTRDLAANRVLLLATYRDAEVGRQHPLASAVRDLTRERLVNKLVMRGLGLESTAALIGARLAVESIPDEFARVVQLERRATLSSLKRWLVHCPIAR